MSHLYQPAEQATGVQSLLGELAHAPVPCPSAHSGTEASDNSTRARIVHIALGTHVGGMEKLLVQFAKFTDRKRFDLAFISLQERGKIAAEIEHHQCPVYAFGKTDGLKPRLVFSLARRLRQLRPNVVHTHNMAAFIYGVTAASLARVPRIIHTQHGQRFNATRRENWVFRTLSRFAYRVVGVSKDVRDLTIAAGIRADRTCLIRNGVDLERFPYVGPTATGPAILAARLSPEKDVATLIRAMKQVSQLMGPRHSTFTLEIAGDGAARTELESLSQSLGLAGQVRFLGERSDIPDLLARASMSVLPSLTEGISLTLLEAMARGLPVVATSVGGNPEVVEEGETGFLVPPANPEALAKTMLRVFQNPILAEKMGRLGRKRVEQEFSIAEMIRKYEQQYVDEDAP